MKRRAEAVENLSGLKGTGDVELVAHDLEQGVVGENPSTQSEWLTSNSVHYGI
jgi:hypothetical protein